MGAQHSYLQNQNVVDTGNGLVYFQDLFSLAGPGGMKMEFQNMPSVQGGQDGMGYQTMGYLQDLYMNSIEATAAAGAQAAVEAATGNGLGYQTMGYLQNLYEKCNTLKHAGAHHKHSYLNNLYTKNCNKVAAPVVVADETVEETAAATVAAVVTKAQKCQKMKIAGAHHKHSYLNNLYTKTGCHTY